MLLGRSIDELLTLPERELRSWRRYWNEEPWGPYRDNLHAALLAIQILRPHLQEGSKAPTLDEFMLKLPEPARPEDVKARSGAFLSSLKAIARKGKKKS